MPPPKNILVTTDLSEDAARAFAPIAELARVLGARITLFNVVATQPNVVGFAGATAPPVGLDPAFSIESVREELAKLGAKYFARMNVEIEIESGVDAPVAIVERSRRGDIDMIAMATHGRSGLKRLALGSVAEAVLRRASMPVLLCPPARE